MQPLVDGNDGLHFLGGKQMKTVYTRTFCSFWGSDLELGMSAISLPNRGAIGTPESVESLGTVDMWIVLTIVLYMTKDYPL